MRKLKTTLLAAAAVAIGFAAAPAYAQTASGWDIVGLKLGVSVSDAQAALKAYNGSVFTTVGYEIDNQGSIVNPIEMFKGDPRATPAFKAPVEIVAVLFTHLYGQLDKELAADSSDPVFTAKGEFYRLEFTPTDQGGKLFQIVRTVLYPETQPADAQALEGKVIAKFGYPAQPANSYDLWMTDIRGRAVAASNREFGRCQTTIGRLNPNQLTISALRGPNGQQMFTAKDIALALSGTDGSTLSATDQNNAATIFGDVRGVTPVTEGSNNAGDRAQYRQCGTLLTFHYDVVGAGVVDFTEVLSDQNAAYFDDGRAAYAKQKMGGGDKGTATSF